MNKITASDVNALRKQTGAGMMDCKKALIEANGDSGKAIDILRKKGQKIAAKRAGRQATEGAVLSATNDNESMGVLVALNCETDFVAKNNDFISLTKKILNIALTNKPGSLDELKSLKFDTSITIGEKVMEQTGVIGEKIELSSYELVEAETVASYIHGGNKLATLVGLTKSGNDNLKQVAKEIAMQVAAMNPIAIDKDDVSKEVVNKELEVAKDLAKQEGKPEKMLEKIAQGRLGKFFKENTLLNQQFIRDTKKSVSQYLSETENGLTVSSFKRVGLGV